MTNFNEDFYTSGFMMDELWDNNLQPNLVPPLNQQPPTPPNIHVDYLFDLINDINQTQLQPLDFIIGNPYPYIGVSYTANTSIAVSPLPMTGYTGSFVFNYPRIDISTVFEQQKGTINLQNATKLSDIISQLNAIYGTDLQPTDYIDTVLPVVNTAYPNLPLVVTIATVPESIKYIGTYDYVLNYTQVAQSQPIDARRMIVLYEGLAPSGSAYKYDMDGVMDTSFVFLQNATAIQTFSVSNSYYRNDGTIYLAGSFALTATVAGIAATGTYVGLLIDQTGSIVQTFTTPLYSFPATSTQYTNRNVEYIYSVNPDNPIFTGISRCNSLGITDTSFTNQLPYIPTMLRITDTGNIYAVSNWFNGPDPYNTGTNALMIRIDRLLPSGSIDLAFMPVFIKISNTTIVGVISVIDIKENQNGNIAILVNSTLGYNYGNPTIVVNGVSLVPVDSNGNSVSTWLPVISLLNNGMLVQPLPNSLNVFSSTAISTNTAAISSDKDILLYSGNDFIFLSYKNNPFTQIAGYQLNKYDNDGTLCTYNPQTYINFPVYSTLYKMDGYADGTVVMSGVLGPVNMAGYSMPVKSMVSIVDPNNIVINLNNPMTGTFPSGTVSISNFFCF